MRLPSTRPFPALALLLVPPPGGDTLLVAPGPGGPPGAFATIQAALDAAADGDDVVLLDGTYTGPGNRDLDFLGKAIALRSQSDDPGACVIDCEHLARGLTMDDGEGPDSLVRGIGFRRGSTVVRFRPPGEGGAIAIVGGSPRIENCAFELSRSGKGGALYLDDSSPTIEDCRFEGGSVSMLCLFGDTPVPCGYGAGIHAENGSSPLISGCAFLANDAQAGGGAIACQYGSSPAIVGCLFEGNTSQNGGALESDFHSNPTLLDCVFVENHANHSGGAISQSYLHDETNGQLLAGCTFVRNTAAVGTGGALHVARPWFVGTSFPLPITRLDRCRFEANLAPRGGAVAASNVALLVSSSAFVDNASSGPGSALHLLNQNPPNAFTLVNCTLLRNAAGSRGSIHCAGVADLRVRNSILWDAPQHTSLADAAVEWLDTCFVSGAWSGAGANVSGEDPLFFDEPSGDVHLGIGSPCADAGAPGLVPPDSLLDLDGEERSMGKRVDVGADERLYRPIRF